MHEFYICLTEKGTHKEAFDMMEAIKVAVGFDAISIGGPISYDHISGVVLPCGRLKHIRSENEAIEAVVYHLEHFPVMADVHI